MAASNGTLVAFFGGRVVFVAMLGIKERVLSDTCRAVELR